MMNSNFNNDRQMPVHIQQQSPYECPDANTRYWISRIKMQWTAWGKSAAVTQILYDFFFNSKNPYEAALMAIVNTDDFYSSKTTSLSYHIVETFLHWKVIFHYRLPPLASHIKIEAFNLVTKQKNFELIKLVVEAFEMKSEKYLLTKSVQALAERKMYKEACHCAIMLELQDHIRIEEFIIPLIFQDKFNIAQEFLNGSHMLQLQTARYLDNMLGEKNLRGEIERVVRELHIFNPRMDKMSGKPLAKLLNKLMTLYDIPVIACPNLKKRKGIGALKFLLGKRYTERTIGEESWSEMVEEAVGDDRELQLDLVSKILVFGDESEAIKWADKYNIPDEMRPSEIQSYRLRSKATSSRPPLNEGSWGVVSPVVPFHQLKLPESSIYLVDDMVKFNSFMESFLSEVFICGVDCEWKPSMGLQKYGVALIQIATFEAIYIVDVLSLMPLLSDNMWSAFIDRIFVNDNLLKVGFSLEGDFAVMDSTLKCMKGLRPIGPGYLDLLALWRNLANLYDFEFPFSGDFHSSHSESLNRLVELTLGEKLDKSDQFSNWEKRPLRKSQIIYAALDAYCLLEVYDVLKTKAENQNIPFLEIVSNIRKTKERERKKPRKKSKKRNSYNCL